MMISDVYREERESIGLEVGVGWEALKDAEIFRDYYRAVDLGGILSWICSNWSIWE
jgi:hypothetical protein